MGIDSDFVMSKLQSDGWTFEWTDPKDSANKETIDLKTCGVDVCSNKVLIPLGNDFKSEQGVQPVPLEYAERAAQLAEAVKLSRPDVINIHRTKKDELQSVMEVLQDFVPKVVGASQGGTIRKSWGDIDEPQKSNALITDVFIELHHPQSSR